MHLSRQDFRKSKDWRIPKMVRFVHIRGVKLSRGSLKRERTNVYMVLQLHALTQSESARGALRGSLSLDLPNDRLKGWIHQRRRRERTLNILRPATYRGRSPFIIFPSLSPFSFFLFARSFEVRSAMHATMHRLLRTVLRNGVNNDTPNCTT